MNTLTADDSRNSFTDGMFANTFATLTGGAFLTGFALYLGMNEFMIGLMGAMPFMVTLFQLPASYYLQKNRARKKYCILWAAAARLLWIPILIVAFLPFAPTFMKWSTILILIFLSYAFASISYISWLSWISDLVPDSMRGSFFGARNMLVGAAGMIAMIIFGNLLDFLKARFDNGTACGLGFTFLWAVLFGVLSIRFLKKVSEPPLSPPETPGSFWQDLSRPFEDINFRRFLRFAFCWSFSVYFASPFFTLYFLRELGFNYGFIATLGVFSGLADLIGMRVWGKLSDKVKNKAIIQLASWVAVFLPFAWIHAKPDSVFLPAILHIAGGGFWAGINLCINNLLLRIAPPDNKGIFFSTFNVIAGLGAGLSPIFAGLLLRSFVHLKFSVLNFNVMPLHLVFLGSTLMRLASMQLLKYVHEPEAASVGQLVRILRNVRGLNLTNGFSFLIHPFIEIVNGKHR